MIAHLHRRLCDLIGRRCGLCGERVRPRWVAAHFDREHCGDALPNPHPPTSISSPDAPTSAEPQPAETRGHFPEASDEVEVPSGESSKRLLLNAENEYGTPVTRMTCTACNHMFTVCPPVDPEMWGSQCLGDNCSSYDLARDVDTFFDALAEHGQLRRGSASHD